LDGKPLIQGDATLYNDYDGTILSFCDENCAKRWAYKNNRTWSEYSCNLGIKDVVNADKDADALDKVSQKAQDYLSRPTLNKATEETRRVVPDVEKPTPKAIKSGSIPLKDVDNIQQIVDDVCDWLGDRIAAFAVLFQDKRSRTEDE
ncbi:MAG: hypothetical protein IKS45_11545, partial [Thermoguttaceae bacterium]|nr:hypothetical protein [Thermoguttaceae bacterium]